MLFASLSISLRVSESDSQESYESAVPSFTARPRPFHSSPAESDNSCEAVPVPPSDAKRSRCKRHGMVLVTVDDDAVWS